MSTSIKIIIALVVLVAIGGIVYLVFFNTNNDTAAVSSGTSGSTASAAEVTFLNLSSQIEPITFDTTILSDPRFVALVDLHTAILPEAIGRSDPFSPN